MGQLVSTLISIGAALGVTLAVFVGFNAFIDLAPRHFTAFAAIAGALLGALVGAAANSGGWFLGGPLWPFGGAVLGALLGGLVWGRFPPSPATRRRLPHRLRPVIFVGPAVLFVGVALIIPTLRTIFLSFFSRRGKDPVGFDNYRSVFGDRGIFNLDGFATIAQSRLFIAGALIAGVAIGYTVIRGKATARGVDASAPVPVVSLGLAGLLVTLAAVGSLTGVIWNNIFWIVLVTGLSAVAGLAIAVLADRSRGESLAKSLIFMPVAISFVGASIIWRFVYAYVPPGHDQIGLLNAIWVALGGDPQTWIQQRPWNTLFLIVIMIWIQTGFAMVLFSAAIKGVPAELLEAARVDGASPGQTFWRITLPQIRTTLGVVVVTLMITVLKVYDIVKVMTNGEFGTNVLANEMFDEAFISLNIGRGSALAVLLLVAVLPLMIYNIRRIRGGTT
jgi:ABC-type sugar transport system permease subunit